MKCFSYQKPKNNSQRKFKKKKNTNCPVFFSLYSNVRTPQGSFSPCIPKKISQKRGVLFASRICDVKNIIATEEANLNVLMLND